MEKGPADFPQKPETPLGDPSKGETGVPPNEQGIPDHPGNLEDEGDDLDDLLDEDEDEPEADVTSQ